MPVSLLPKETTGTTRMEHPRISYLDRFRCSVQWLRCPKSTKCTERSRQFGQFAPVIRSSWHRVGMESLPDETGDYRSRVASQSKHAEWVSPCGKGADSDPSFLRHRKPKGVCGQQRHEALWREHLKSKGFFASVRGLVSGQRWPLASRSQMASVRNEPSTDSDQAHSNTLSRTAEYRRQRVKAARGVSRSRRRGRP